METVEAVPTAPKTQEFVLSDALWARIEPLLPAEDAKPHPLGCYRQRVSARTVLTGIFFVLRTGCQWKALDVTGLVKGSTAHRRYQEWCAAGVFERLWEAALAQYDDVIGLDVEWLSLDGALHKAPLGGEKNGSQSLRSRQWRRQAQPASGRAGHSRGAGH